MIEVEIYTVLQYSLGVEAGHQIPGTKIHSNTAQHYHEEQIRRYWNSSVPPEYPTVPKACESSIRIKWESIFILFSMLSFRAKGNRNHSSFGDFQEKHLNVTGILNHKFFLPPLHVAIMLSIVGLMCMSVYFCIIEVLAASKSLCREQGKLTYW